MRRLYKSSIYAGGDLGRLPSDLPPIGSALALVNRENDILPSGEIAALVGLPLVLAGVLSSLKTRAEAEADDPF